MAENLQLGIKITADAGGAKAAITSTAEELRKIGTATKDANARASKNINQLKNDLGLLSGAARVASSAFAALGATLGAREIMRTVDAYANVQARIKLVSGSVNELATANEALYRISQQNLAPLQATASMYARIAQSIADMGRSQQDALAITDLVGKTLRISGASAEEASSAILQFGQALGAGVLQGEELKAILESSPRLAKALADALKVTTGQLKGMGAAGELTSRQVVDALLSQGDTIRQEYGKIPVTISAAFTQLENAFTRYIGSADQASGVSRQFAESLSKLADNLPRILDGMSAFGKGVINLLQSVGSVFDSVSDKFSRVEGWLRKVPALATALDRSMAAGSNAFDLPGKEAPKPDSQYSTGGGFGSEDATFFQGAATGASKTAQQYIAAANAAWKLSAAQQKVVETIVKIGDSKGFDPAFLLSIARAETRLGELNRVSSAGAKGVFQFMDGTARRFGVRDPWNLEQATNGAILYLGKLKTQFKSVGLAAAGYNAGEGNVQKYGGVPPFKETQTYVRRVLQNMQDLQRAMGGSSDEVSKEIKQAEKDQYQSYVDHLKSREAAFDDYSQRALAEQRTMMERLSAAQEDAAQKAQAAMAGGDLTAIKAAEDQQRKFLEDKKALLLQGIAIEEEATRKKIAHIGMEIAQAQKLNQYDGIDRLKRDRSAELGELAQLAERRKQIEIGVQSDISQAAQKFEDQRRQAQKQAADDNAQLVADQRQAAEDAYRQMQQVMDLRMTESANLADARKQDIDNQLEAAKAETATAQARRQASLEGLTGLQAQQAAREVLNANLRDSLDLVELEKTKTLEKLVIDGNVLAQQRQLLEVYKEIAQQQGNNEQALALEKQLQEVYAGQAKNIRDRVKAQTEAAAKSAKAQFDADKQGMDTQEVRESQLRMNAFWDQYMGRLQDYSNTWAQITGETENGFSRMAIAMGEYAKQTAQIKQVYEEMRRQAGDSQLLDIGEGLAQGQAALNAMAKTMLALRSQYKEGSDGYDRMTNAAERMMEVQRALQVVEGVLAVVHQLSAGDVYTAIPRALGVAAMVASLGIQTGAAGGVSNRQAREMAQSGGSAAMGGGVFGDASGKSDSIAKSLEIVSANSSADLAYSAGMLRSLKNIELSLGGTTNAIIRGVKPADVQGLGYKGFGMAIDPLGIGKLIGSGVYTKITNWGIKALPQQLDQILAKGFAAMNWTEVTKTTKILGITLSKSVKNIYSALDVGVTGQITRVIRSMADTVREAGKAFGISGEQFMSAMKGFTVNFGTLSTKGLKGDELEKAVQQVFSSMSDDMAQAFQSRFDLGLEPFMQAGEGMFQTLVRVADGINVATGMLAQAGLQAINYQEIVYKQGDIAAEIVRQSIVAFEGVNTAIGAYVDQAVGSAEELMSVYQDLLLMSDVAQVVGFNFRTLTNEMIVVAGGVNKFLASLQTYQTDILGTGDYAAQVIGLQREFSKLGIELPRTNAEFVKLVDSISTATPEGARLYAQIMNLAGAFAKAQKAAADLAALQDKYNLDPLKGYKSRITDIQKDFDQIIQGVLAGMPGGPDYVRRNQKIKTLDNRIGERLDDRADKRDELQGVQDQIDVLEAKGKLTQKERTQLANLRMQRKAINGEIAAIDAEISGYRKQIDKINERIRKDPNNENLLAERNRLIEEQGSALLSTLSDIFDQINATVENARDTLQSIRDNIFELSGEVGGPNAKVANATIRAGIAGEAYRNYQGDDIAKRTDLANKYRDAIMGEYEAKKAAIEATQTAIEKERDARQKAHDEAVGALQKQLDKARELNDAIKSIQKFARDLLTGGNSPLSPRAQLQAAQQQYQDLLARASTGDVTALQGLGDSASTYLEAAKKYYGSGGQFGAIFDGVQKAMESLGAMDPGDQDSIQAKIDELNANHEKYLKSIDEQIAALKIDEQLKSLQDETIAKLDALEKSFAPAVERAAEQAKEQMAELIELARAQNILNDAQLIALGNLAAAMGIEGYQYQDPQAATPPTTPAPPTTPPPPTVTTGPNGTTTTGTDANGNEYTINQWAKPGIPPGYKGWEDLWKTQRAQWKDDHQGQTWKQWKLRIRDMYKVDYPNITKHMPAYAQGGMAQPGWALVGEEGPELVKFGSSAQVFDAEKTAEMLRQMASFQPVAPEMPRPINLERMPRLIDDLPKRGKPINLEIMPRVIDDLPRRDREPARLSTDGEVIAELKAMRTELRALVTTQSGANPQMIERLSGIERRLAYMERDAKLKPA